MNNSIIIAIVAAAIIAIVGLKLFQKANDTPQTCPCSMTKQAVSNQTDAGASDVD